ncbi:MAG: HNH endonuclease [Mucilaginibacter sp.]|nr:HNH endonuclease [Mucilaginibacter sp.]
MTLEHYCRWYELGAAGEPTCLDKSRIYDFSYTTIEHIYPKNAQGAVINQTMEPLKNTIGNLTFMGPGDNVLGANNDFNTKRPIFQQSSVRLNTLIGVYPQWDATTLKNREQSLKDMACKIFNI